ncbi:MAG TPA: CoA transferase, partial [Advenella sp.]|nr:CoA transferase [Advenella sp.]
SRIFNIKDIFADPHYKAREMIVAPEDPLLGPVAMANVIPKLSRTPGAVLWSGRDTGHDTQVVLSQLAGLTQDQIDELSEQNIIHKGTAPVSADALAR